MFLKSSIDANLYHQTGELYHNRGRIGTVGQEDDKKARQNCRALFIGSPPTVSRGGRRRHQLRRPERPRLRSPGRCRRPRCRPCRKPEGLSPPPGGLSPSQRQKLAAVTSADAMDGVQQDTKPTRIRIDAEATFLFRHPRHVGQGTYSISRRNGLLAQTDVAAVFRRWPADRSADSTRPSARQAARLGSSHESAMHSLSDFIPCRGNMAGSIPTTRSPNFRLRPM